MRYYLIAGEASGDLHGSNLIKALHAQDAAADIRCWGGDKMQAAGATLVKHYRELAFMGFVEVIRHLPTILRNIRFCKEDILAYRPDVLVLVDYPGFNMRIAEWAKAQGIKIVYYISPQVWAWKEGRVKKIKASVDRMLVILPFEVPFYQKWHYPVDYVGHPLIEVVRNAKAQPITERISPKPLIALLPGSRKQEIIKKLTVMLSQVDKFPNYQFVIAAAPSQPDELYQSIIGNWEVMLLKGRTYDILKEARAALVTSGTATLETALFAVPQVVCYRTSPGSYWLAKRLIKIKYISLANLIMDKPVVEELIQDDLNPTRLNTALARIATDGPARSQMLQDYAQLSQMLGNGTTAAQAAAIVIATATT